MIEFCYPDKSNIDRVKSLYLKHRDSLGIPFERVFDAMLDNKNFVVAMDGELVIGLCGIHFRKRYGFYEVEHLCVDSAYRNQHIAIRMLQILFSKAISQNRRLFCYPVFCAYAIDGMENNKFYDRLCTNYHLVKRKNIVLRRYYFDVEGVMKYGS